MKHVILGNGPAGVVAAETLRQQAPRDSIVLVGAEREPPYSRMAIPYLLMGHIGEDGTYLRKSADHFQRLNIQLVQAKATRLDDQSRQVALDNGQSLAYDRLLIATGSHPIRPPVPGIDLPGVHTCWTLEDSRAIAQRAGKGKRVLQIGAGFIGCIIMEALSERGVQLTVVEMGDRMVPRMMTPNAGNMIRRWVESKGVRVITNARVDRIEAGAPLKALLSTGDTIDADLIIASAGVRPNIDFLQGSRVKVGQGVLVDQAMRTSVPEIFGAGDVVEAAEFSTGKGFVNAIQPNAVDQARVAALNMLGQATHSQGALAINVLDTLGLISTSFGQWGGVSGGQGVEEINDGAYRYLSLQFDHDVLVGATAIGLTQHVGVLRGLIQNRTQLGGWKDTLLSKPERFVEAYVARSQPVSITH
ncbi:MAG: NAD(P)/FAD-dependent oxidoreductase [Gemmatimonadota bacterium]